MVIRGDTATRLSDAGLMEAARGGSLEAFEELARRHQGALFSYFLRVSHDRATAEDCTQEILLKLYIRRAAYTPQAKFTTYLYAVCRNFWIDRLRAHPPHRRPLQLESCFADDDRTIEDALAGPAPAPQAFVEHRDRADAVRRALDSLPDEQRAVLIMSEEQQMSHREIAAFLAVPVGTVKSRKHTALERLRHLLDDDLD